MLSVLMCYNVKVMCVGFRGRNGTYIVYNNVFFCIQYHHLVGY